MNLNLSEWRILCSGKIVCEKWNSVYHDVVEKVGFALFYLFVFLRCACVSSLIIPKINYVGEIIVMN